ncbi:lipoprotein insertase outer membrane protein LolB [Paraglaciecola aestuariivivens]
MLAYQAHIKPILLVSLLLAFLTGCATAPAPSINLHAQQHQQALAKLKNWTIKGKIGFKGPSKKQSANFRWQQQSQQYQINLTSIIGSALLSLNNKNGVVELITDEQTYLDKDPANLIWRVSGWQIPVEPLRIWIKGQYQANDQVKMSPQGWLAQLTPVCENCSGWRIEYNQYKKVGELWLPHKVVLSNSLTNSQLLIRINDWSLDEN